MVVVLAILVPARPRSVEHMLPDLLVISQVVLATQMGPWSIPLVPSELSLYVSALVLIVLLAP